MRRECRERFPISDRDSINFVVFLSENILTKGIVEFYKNVVYQRGSSVCYSCRSTYKRHEVMRRQCRKIFECQIMFKL